MKTNILILVTLVFFTSIAFCQTQIDRSIFVNATLTNKLDTKMTFMHCNATIGKISELEEVIYPKEHQSFHVTQSIIPIKIVSGTCAYTVIINDETIVVDVLYYRNTGTGHEYYGVTAHEAFNVLILITKPGNVQYVLMDQVRID